MHSLSSAIDNFPSVKVLVIGDLMLDRFIYGKIERISPEAPVPIFKVERSKEMLGGAGNVAANLRALGCHVSYVGLVGNDVDGSTLTHLLRESRVRAYLLQPENFPTIVKSRLIAGSNHISRVDREEKAPDLSHSLPVLMERFRRLASRADIVLLSDYGKGLLTTQNTPQLIEICQKLNKRVIVDPKGADYSKYIGATLVKPNLKEFTEVTGGIPFDPSAPDFEQRLSSAAADLITRFHLGNILITLGEHGMALISAEEPTCVCRIPTKAREVYDVSGAGDTSLATLGATLALGIPVVQAMRLANIASGVVVGKVGTATVSATELRSALLTDEASLPDSTADPTSPQRKICSLAAATTLVDDLRKTGKVIGFTNGVFDCCHMGHLSSLMAARKECDVLVVGVNSDACVKRLKGEGRPIHDERTRALLLASLEFVDCVILFDEDTPMEIIKNLRPDVLAKEGYTIDRWPEAQYAQGYGAKIVTLTRVGNYSTTALINKMK